jgi:hypothetical protein
LRLILAKLKMKATNKTDMAAINTHMMDWYGWVGSAIKRNKSFQSII